MIRIVTYISLEVEEYEFNRIRKVNTELFVCFINSFYGSCIQSRMMYILKYARIENVLLVKSLYHFLKQKNCI